MQTPMNLGFSTVLGVTAAMVSRSLACPDPLRVAGKDPKLCPPGLVPGHDALGEGLPHVALITRGSNRIPGDQG